MDNYEYCAQWVLTQKRADNFSILDYGCGAGEIVKKLRRMNLNAFGCDNFYGQGKHRPSTDSRVLDKIKIIRGNTIPFDDKYFDLIINNQVIEHVENLDNVLSEIHRVLKSGGIVLSLFPDKGVWREGHCGIPFLHWFPKYSNFRVYYASILRALGLGYDKRDKSIIQWSRDSCDWLDKRTYYRSTDEIFIAFNKYFCDLQHIEDQWLVTRFSNHKWIHWLPAKIQRLIVRKLGGLVFVSHKPD